VAINLGQKCTGQALRVKKFAQVNKSQILSQYMAEKNYFDWEISDNMTKSGEVSGNSVKVKCIHGHLDKKIP
jgi:hypothetical protein